MINTADELRIAVKHARLLSGAEFAEYKASIPEPPGFGFWWLSDIDKSDSDYAGYVENDYYEDNMFIGKGENLMYLRTALDIETAKINVGKEFVYRGCVFTVLSQTLAIANGFQGTVKFNDPETLKRLNDDEYLFKPYEDSIYGVIYYLFEY